LIIKKIGLIVFIAGILLITSSTVTPLPVAIVNVVGALLIAYGVLNLIDLIQNIASDNKKIIGLIAFIAGMLLISYSAVIPLPSIFINIVGALLLAYGVLNLIHEYIE